MDKSFKAAVAFYKPIAKISHQQTVMRLYRNCLRNLTSWIESRELWCEEAIKIRASFDAQKSLKDDATINRLLREAQEKLDLQTHPDKYIHPAMPGGSLFMRNPAIPLEALYPDGVPEGMSKRRMNVDMSNVPEDQEFADKVLVDSASKSYWIDR